MDTKVLVPLGAALVVVLGGVLLFPFKRTPPPEYRAALEKWRSVQMRDYELRIEERCQLCIYGPVLISIRNGQVADVRPGNPPGTMETNRFRSAKGAYYHREHLRQDRRSLC
jgi:hypothetical protein